MEYRTVGWNEGGGGGGGGAIFLRKILKIWILGDWLGTCHQIEAF